MSAGTSLLFCLICFLVCSCSALEITAVVGEKVILPCKVPNINTTNISVEWIRYELEPKYVFLYQNGRFDPYSQHPSYKNRVDLQDEEMKDGDFSLILKDVTTEDTGKYECRVFQGGNNELINIVNLEVHPPAQTNIRADFRRDVILPCKAPNNINIRAVEWIRYELDPDHVLLYRNGRLDLHNQLPSYKNRVDLQDKDMKDGDVSLILKNVTMEDTGRYKCRVYEEGKKDSISIITLRVLLSGSLPENNSDRGDNVGIIVGSVVGVILLLLVVVSVGFLIYRRHMRQNPNLQFLLMKQQMNRCQHFSAAADEQML